MNNICCKAFVVVVGILCLVLSSLGSQTSDNHTNVEGTAGVWLQNMSYGSAYTVTLNGEPVCWTDGASHTLLHGYPIQQGTNRIAVNMVFPPHFRDFTDRRYPIRTPHIQIRLYVQETDKGPLIDGKWENVDQWNSAWTTNEPAIWDSEFVMENKVSIPVFEELGTNKSLYISQCRVMAVKLAKLVQKQDYEQLTRVFGLNNRTGMKTGIPPVMALENNIPSGAKAILLDECPSLVYRVAVTNEFSVSGVSKEAEVEAITGKYLILIHSVANSHLASFSDPKVIGQWSHNVFAKLRHDGVFNIDSFVFGRVNGNWKFAANNQGWIKNGGGITPYGSGWLALNLQELDAASK